MPNRMQLVKQGLWARAQMRRVPSGLASSRVQPANEWPPWQHRACSEVAISIAIRAMTLRYHTPLSPDEQVAFGISEPQPLAMADRVRFAELDVLNHVNNKSYMGWFESLRVAHYDHFCAPLYQDLPRPRTVLRSANMHFVKEMLMGEDYVTTARVTAFRNTSYTIEQQLWAGDLRATLTGVMVMLLPDGSGRYPLPDSLRQMLIDTNGAVPET